ncbi:MAG: ATP-binding domain-containing protein, partial [Nitrospiraceae bacterium]|nr:ATP-binding domain-containing protein [Nitrospiraceae bacterium]
EYAYAMTVHKSQGSEFDHVLLLLGGFDHPLLTRSLLYTGATRAKNRLTVWASRAILERMLRRPLERLSALSERLADRLARP